MFRAAADSYVKLKDFPKAILNYDKSGMFGVCAELSKKIGDRRMESVYKNLAELLGQARLRNKILVKNVNYFFSFV